MINTKINLFVQENLLVWWVSELIVASCWGNKLTTKLFSAWSKFPISVLLPLTICMWNMKCTVQAPHIYIYIFHHVSCGRWFFHFCIYEKCLEMFVFFLFKCFLPSEKYPDSKIEQVFTACEPKQQPIKSHKSHRNSVPFLYILH